MNKTQTLSFHRRNLPHWYVANKTYFVTFCLKGAIPLTVLNKLRIELNVFIQTHPSEKELDDFHRRRFIKVEKFGSTEEYVGKIGKNSPWRHRGTEQRLYKFASDCRLHEIMESCVQIQSETNLHNNGIWRKRREKMLVEVQPTDGETRFLKTSPSLSKKQVVLSNLTPNVRGQIG